MSEASKDRWVLRDLGAGLLAIVAVVGVSVRASFVGSDLRVLMGITAVAFYLAGVARGRVRHLSLGLRGLLVSCPGLLGTAALIVNDGLHRLPIPIGVTLTAIVSTIAGLQTRDWWNEARSRAIAMVGAFACALALELALVHALVMTASLHRVDRVAPAFELQSFSGDTLRSGDLRGKVVVLAYWASWCLPCHWERPELESAFSQVKGDSTVVFLAVDAGWGGETMDRGRRYLARRPANVSAAFDAGGAAAAALGVHALPTLLFLDRSGRIRYEHYGFDRSERVDRVIVDCIRRLQREPPH